MQTLTKKRKQINILAIALLVATVLVSSVGLSFAWFTDTQYIGSEPGNEIVFNEVLLENGVEFTATDGVYDFIPTSLGDYETPNFSLDTTETSINVLLRVRITVSWKDEYGDYTSLLPSGNELTFGFGTGWIVSSTSLFIDYYYDGVITAYTTTPTNIFSTVTLVNDAANGDYINQTAEIQITAELIQANATGFNKWADETDYPIPATWDPLNLV